MSMHGNSQGAPKFGDQNFLFIVSETFDLGNGETEFLNSGLVSHSPHIHWHMGGKIRWGAMTCPRFYLKFGNFT
jgi:hypothetical protein